MARRHDFTPATWRQPGGHCGAVRTRGIGGRGGATKGVVFLGDRKLELPDPTPGARDVILEIRASGMCGSDLHMYRAPARGAEAVMGGIKRDPD